MRFRHTTFSLSLLVLLALSLAWSPAASAQQNSLCEVIQLTNNNTNDAEPQIDDGQIVWGGYDGNDVEIYLWDGETTTQLTNNETDDDYPQIDNGQVVWFGDDGNDYEIFFWNGTTTIQLTNNGTHDVSPQVDNGEVVWGGWDGNDWEIYFWDSSITTQLTDNDTLEGGYNISNGQVVFAEEDWDTGNWGIYFWDGVSVTQVTESADGSAPKIDNGHILWESGYQIYLWDGESIIHISDSSHNNFESDIDNAQVTWIVPNNSDFDIFFWDGDSSRNISTDLMVDRFPSISNGQIAWYGQDIFLNNYIFFWDGNNIIQLSNNVRTFLDVLVRDGPQINNGQIVWYSFDGNDYEIFFADCTKYPKNLTVSGDLDTPPVHPTLQWSQQLAPSQTENPASEYRVYLAKGTNNAKVLDHTAETASICTGLNCELSLDGLIPRWGLLNGDYKWWVGAVVDGTTHWSERSDFSVTVPAPALPDPITVDPADGRIAVTFPDDPNTLWVQVWVGPHPKGAYYQWHERDGAGKSFTCDSGFCTLHPAWDVMAKDASDVPYDLTVWMQAWGSAGYSTGGTAAPTAPAWNKSATFNLPTDPAILPSDIAVGGLPHEPGFSWTGGANATWYNVVVRPTGSTTVVHSSWHQAWAANCPGALVSPSDYTCSVANLGLSGKLMAGSDYDVFIRAWGSGGMSSGSGIPGMDQYAQGGPFTYNP